MRHMHRSATTLLKYSLFSLSILSTMAHADTSGPNMNEFNALEKRVELLEKAINTPVPTSPKSTDTHAAIGVSGHWVMDTPADRYKNWHAIKPGMSAEDVKSLLGSPSNTIKVNWQHIWYYQTSSGNGSIVFSNTGTVSQVQIPPVH